MGCYKWAERQVPPSARGRQRCNTTSAPPSRWGTLRRASARAGATAGRGHPAGSGSTGGWLPASADIVWQRMIEVAGLTAKHEADRQAMHPAGALRNSSPCGSQCNRASRFRRHSRPWDHSIRRGSEIARTAEDRSPEPAHLHQQPGWSPTPDAERRSHLCHSELVSANLILINALRDLTADSRWQLPVPLGLPSPGECRNASTRLRQPCAPHLGTAVAGFLS